MIRLALAAALLLALPGLAFGGAVSVQEHLCWQRHEDGHVNATLRGDLSGNRYHHGYRFVSGCGAITVPPLSDDHAPTAVRRINVDFFKAQWICSDRAPLVTAQTLSETSWLRDDGRHGACAVGITETLPAAEGAQAVSEKGAAERGQSP